MVPSYDLRDPAYRTASYRRPGAAYDFLEKFLGKPMFKNALQEYMRKWNGKHPTPYDFFFTFDKVTGEDLSWYWKPWFFETKYPDLSLSNIEFENRDVNLIVQNIGGLPLPIIVKAYYEDGSNKTVINKSASVWKAGNQEIKLRFTSDKKVTKLELGTTQIPDTDLKNNHFIRK